MKLSEIALKINGEVIGDDSLEISALALLNNCPTHHLTYSKSQSARKLIEQINTSKPFAILILKKFASENLPDTTTYVLVEDPQSAIIDLIPSYHPPINFTKGISAQAQIAPSAELGECVSVGAFVVIGENVKVGRNTVIHPNVTIYPNTEIGENCIIHSGTSIRENCILGNNIVLQNGSSIGSDGFGYIPDLKQVLKSVPQVGNVILGDFVDVGANTCIDRAALGATKLGTGVKLDNLVQVGHNVQIGNYSILCGKAGVAGSAVIGDGVTVGGATDIADHVTIVDGVRLAGKSGVTSSLTEKGDYAGFPAVPALQWKRFSRLLVKLPEIVKRLNISLKNE